MPEFVKTASGYIYISTSSGLSGIGTTSATIHRPGYVYVADVSQELTRALTDFMDKFDEGGYPDLVVESWKL